MPKPMLPLKQLMATSLGISTTLIAAKTAPPSTPAVRASYLFNSGIAGIEEADAIMIIGANPRREAPVLNARIRKRYCAADASPLV